MGSAASDAGVAALGSIFETASARAAAGGAADGLVRRARLLLTPPAGPSLEVDCTSCAGVSYLSARLVASLTSPPVLLRRLPAWAAQPWACVQHTNVPPGELHTYFPDGSFQFSRADQNRGDVHTFRPAAGGGPHFELVVRYAFEDTHPLAAPHYRPGVCVLHTGEGEMRTAQLSWGPDSAVPPEVPLAGPVEGMSLGLWRVKTAAMDDDEADDYQ